MVGQEAACNSLNPVAVHAEVKTLEVSSEEGRMRLDQFVVRHLRPALSRSQVARMIRADLVTVNGSPARAASLVRTGDRVEIAAAPAFPAAVVPVPPGAVPELDILYADPALIIVNKPADLAVHAGAGSTTTTLIDALLARFPDLVQMAEPDGLVRPGIVHRLDKGTSGVMAVGRTPHAKAELSRQFMERTVRKLYLAVVRGHPAGEEFTVERPLGRHPSDRVRMSIRSRKPRPAITHVRVIARFGQARDPSSTASLLLVRPQTGRTHQIRVHLAASGHPCLGDPLYGRGGKPAGVEFSRQALHALILELDHPESRSRMRFLAPLPTDMASLLANFGVTANAAAIERWAAML